jgi:hypothetical protein
LIQEALCVFAFIPSISDEMAKEEIDGKQASFCHMARRVLVVLTQNLASSCCHLEAGALKRAPRI